VRGAAGCDRRLCTDLLVSSLRSVAIVELRAATQVGLASAEEPPALARTGPGYLRTAAVVTDAGPTPPASRALPTAAALIIEVGCCALHQV
jgi:hypothetical protein